MKVIYTQRYVRQYAEYSICPYISIELDKNYTKKQLDQLVKNKAMEDCPEEGEVYLFADPYITIGEFNYNKF